MVLEGKRIILRPFKKEDSVDYFKVSSEKSIKKYLPYASANTLKECDDLVNNYSTMDFINDFYFVIEEKQTHQIIGSLLAFRRLSTSLEICYLIGNEYRGKEYCVESLNIFIEYLKQHTIYKTLLFDVCKSNISSLTIMKKINAKIHEVSESSINYKYHIKSAK